MAKKTTVGRPTIYNKSLAKEICDTIACNGKGLKKLCEENPHWPNKDTFFTWIKNKPEFSDQYARAKRFQVEALIDEILDIADDSSLDQTTHDDGSSSCNSVFIARSRLRIDTRKWLASKLVPKLYGSKSDPTPDIDDKLKDELNKLRASLDLKYLREY